MDTGAPIKPTANRKPTSAEARRSLKNQRKNAAREALRRQEAARRKRNSALGALAAVIVVVGGVWAVTALHGSKAKPVAAAAPSSSPTGAAAGPQAAPVSCAAMSPGPSAAPVAWPGVPANENPALKTQPKITAGTGTVSKLVVTTLIKGAGPVVKQCDDIVVNYIGATYADGKVFDSSWSHKQTFPLSQIGAAQVITGWNQGLVGVTVGSRVQLDIPQALAYPDASNGQPAGTLRFIVDVLSDSPAVTSAS